MIYKYAVIALLGHAGTWYWAFKTTGFWEYFIPLISGAFLGVGVFGVIMLALSKKLASKSDEKQT